MCTNGTDVMERARWDGARGTSRERLLVDVQRTAYVVLILLDQRLTLRV
jgi:hypothetical protein